MIYHTNADLHCHSCYSDGALSPEKLAKRAKANGVTLWALTDHDELGGQESALQAAHAASMDYLTGVEVSVTYQEKTIHILGLGIDDQNSDLLAGLEMLREGRLVRAQLIADDLAKNGVSGALEGALRWVTNPTLVSRTHFAMFLIKSSYCSSKHEVFQRYLTLGKPGGVNHQWASIEDALTWIKGAGGMAVLAHPGRYSYTSSEKQSLLARFKYLGGKGIEVITGNHNGALQKKYLEIAKNQGFYVSRGSDFHRDGEGKNSLGKLPIFPNYVPTIWMALADRIHSCRS